MAKLHSASPCEITLVKLYPNYTQKHVITYTNRGNDEGGSAAQAVPARFTCHCYSSFLYYFSLDWSSKGTVGGRYERFVFLFLALVCRAFCFCLWVQ